MPIKSTVARVLDRATRGESILLSAQLELVDIKTMVTVDAHYDGKPVCPVLIDYIIDGVAVQWMDSKVPSSIAMQRAESLASALLIPLCVIHHQGWQEISKLTPSLS
jgi:hypothetical protein